MATVIVGAQWGDEGKGKVTHLLARDAHLIARYGGGSNAGHTVLHDGKTFKLHLIPSGIFYPEALNILGPGMVIDPAILLQEIHDLKEAGIPCTNLRISPLAHLVMPYHRLLDLLEEERRGKDKLGTTGRGIGPAYGDRVLRTGIRVDDLSHEKIFREKLAFVLEQKKRSNCSGALHDHEALNFEKIAPQYLEYAAALSPYLADTQEMIFQGISSGKKLLFEGAQGAMLDLDFGTYPYVTSSHTGSGGASVGLGIPPTVITEVVGVAKAYSTRVGEGVFPTELQEEEGKILREKGGEYGATTGRPRRCGWLDGVMLRYGARMNGYTSLAITKLDVLTGLPAIKFCTAYRLNGKPISAFPVTYETLTACEPIYEEFEGWGSSLRGARRLQELPPQARRFIERISEYLSVPISIISVGPTREETVLV